MRQRRLRAPRVMAEINITPFTDVILVLLIIFMIAAPVISRNSIEVVLPKASSAVASHESREMDIAVTAEGVVYIDNHIVTAEDLRRLIDEQVAKDPDIKVSVSADQSCRFQDVVRVIDALKAAGVKNLNITAQTIDVR